MEDNHTPTPWKLIRGTKEKLSKIKKGKYTLELQGYGYQQKKEIEDAEFIVTACNNYQALKAENTLLKEVNEAQIFTIEKYQKENESLTTQLAKVNSDKERLGELLKENRRTFLMIGDDYTDNKQHDRAEVWYDEVRKADECLTNCGITL